MMRSRRNFKLAAFILFFGLIALYAYYQTRYLWQGPRITVSQPANNATLAEPFVSLRGTARRISHLSLNGRQIFTDDTGYFEEQLLLASGYNIMTLEARDRFGRTAGALWQLVYQPR